jgi:hypothetical protein
MITDADIEMLEMEAAGNAIAAAKRAGRCPHAAQQAACAARPDLKAGHAQCLDCGTVAAAVVLDAEYDDIMADY